MLSACEGSGFLAEIKGYITHICLDLPKRQREFVMTEIVDHIVGRKFHKVVHFDRHDIRKQITTLKGKIFDDEVQRLVRVLNSRNRDVSDLQNKSSS